MRILYALACAAVLAGPASAQSAYDSLTVSTTTGRARRATSGYVGVAKSSQTPTTYTISLDGPKGGVNASSATLVYGLKAATGAFSGAVSAASFSGDGSGLTGLASAESNTFTSSKTFTQNVLGKASATFSGFFGDGSHLTGIPSTGSVLGAVLKTGDTMTGTLQMSATNIALNGGQGYITGSSSFTTFGGVFGNMGSFRRVGIGDDFDPFIGAGIEPGADLHIRDSAIADILLTDDGSGHAVTDGLIISMDGPSGVKIDNQEPATITGLYHSGVVTFYTEAAGATLASDKTLTLSGASGKITGASSVTASGFFGNGSGLTNTILTASSNTTSAVNINSVTFVTVSTLTVTGMRGSRYTQIHIIAQIVNGSAASREYTIKIQKDAVDVGYAYLITAQNSINGNATVNIHVSETSTSGTHIYTALMSSDSAGATQTTTKRELTVQEF